MNVFPKKEDICVKLGSVCSHDAALPRFPLQTNKSVCAETFLFSVVKNVHVFLSSERKERKKTSV